MTHLDHLWRNIERKFKSRRQYKNGKQSPLSFGAYSTRNLFLGILMMMLLASCVADPLPPQVEAVPTQALSEDSDLGESEVETAEPPLPPEETAVPTELPTKTPPPVPSPMPTPSAAPEASQPTNVPLEEPVASVLNLQEITFQGAEDQEIAATYATPDGLAPFPAVILLHMLGGRRQVWVDSGLTQVLVDHGFAVIAIDMRGHGETGGTRDWDLARQDMALVMEQVAQFSEIAAEHTAVIGGSIGANLALQTAADQARIQTAILLSPGLDYQGVTTDDEVVNYGERPLLVVASEEDTYAAESSQSLVNLAPRAELQLYDGAGHGTNMLTREPALTQLILDWLLTHIGG